MAGFSSGLRLGVALFVGCASVGCATGALLESARLDERVLRYDDAHVSGDRLRLAYEVELHDREGREGGVARREVALQMADLRAEPEIAVEAFPVARLPVGGGPGYGSRVPLILTGAAKLVAGPQLVVVAEGDRHVGLELLSPGFAPARFHSGALHRSHYRWWVYPLLPFSALLDLALLVPEVAASFPLFLVNE